MIVVIPAYEPDIRLIGFVKRLHENKELKIIVVNDGSSESREGIFKHIKDFAVILKHNRNLGKGSAIKTALSYAAENMPDEDGICTADADGQHKITDILAVCNALKRNKNKLILGVRNFKGKVPLRSRFGNKVTSIVFKLTSGKNLSDTQTGLRAFGMKYLSFMKNISGERYEYEMNVLMSCAKNNIDFVEVPIDTVYHNGKNESSHFDTVKDSFRIYKSILKFSCSSFVSFLADYLLFNLFMLFAGNYVILCNVAARFISAFLNYTINKKLVFQSNDKSPKSALSYFALALFILIANTALLKIFTLVGIPAYAAKLMTEIILFIVSLTVQKFLIFKNAEAQK